MERYFCKDESLVGVGSETIFLSLLESVNEDFAEVIQSLHLARMMLLPFVGFKYREINSDIIKYSDFLTV